MCGAQFCNYSGFLRVIIFSQILFSVAFNIKMALITALTFLNNISYSELCYVSLRNPSNLKYLRTSDLSTRIPNDNFSRVNDASFIFIAEIIPRPV